MKIITAFFLAGIFMLSAVCAQEVEIVAKVNNGIITSKDLYEYTQILAYHLTDNDVSLVDKNETGKMESQALNRLVEDRLILDKAQKEDIPVPPEWINSKLEQVMSSYPSRTEFEQSLIEKGLNVTLLKKKIEEQYLMHQVIEKYVKDTVKILPQEVSRYYQDNQNEFVSPRKYVIWMAVIEDADLLKKICQLIRDAGIAAAAKESPSVLAKFESTLEELITEIATPLANTQKGDFFVKAVEEKTHLIYLEDILPEQLIPLDEVKESLHSFLWEKKFREKFTEWVGELKEKAVVKIYLPG